MLGCRGHFPDGGGPALEVMLRGTAARAHRVALINKLDVDGLVIEPKHTTVRFVGCLTGERCSGDADCEQCGRTRRS